MRQTSYASPLGEIGLAIDGDTVHCLIFGNERGAAIERVQQLFGELSPGRLPKELRASLDAYFAGELTALDSIAVDLAGTDFQRRVWAELRKIPAGETRSYLDLARALGRPGAMRAVGRANATNPVSLIVPCHRVIRADGDLSGYGGEVWRKRWLLEHEGVLERTLFEADRAATG